MSNLLDLANAIVGKTQHDPDAVELLHVAATISACAEDMIQAINVAMHEEQVYRTMLTVASGVGPNGPEDAEWLHRATEDADRQGEVADAAAKQVECIGRELAKKVLHTPADA
jgi:hypothetical protein